MAELLNSNEDSAIISPELNLNFQTLTIDGEEAKNSDSEPSHILKGIFLKPLLFPEAPIKDLSHFIDPLKDIPIYCLIPTCSETFGVKCETKISDEERVKLLESVSAGCGNDGVKFEKASAEMVKSGNGRQAGVIVGIGEEGITKTPKLSFSPKDEWLRHIFMSHKIVIDKVNEISSLKSYSLYWRTRLSQFPITDFAAVIRTNSTNDARYDPPEDYYLLSDALPEEKQLREQLQLKKLEAVLIVQQKEREDTNFSRTCLFCSRTFTGNRSLLFHHLLDKHSFNVGQPDNLVFVSEFLDLLQQKLDNLQCLYCERKFRDYTTLKDHMRKKQHKKISPQNHAYDQFYIINYLELGKTWEQVQAEDDREIMYQVEDSEWSDWQESEDFLVFCLFCTHSSKNFHSLLEHIVTAHGFDYRGYCRRLHLDYYRQIKVVNYIRRKVHMNACCFCNQQYHTHKELSRHMCEQGHYMLPHDSSTWDQAQYFFPTFENDAFLFLLENTS